jgi:secreted trypsin-like serine protease
MVPDDDAHWIVEIFKSTPYGAPALKSDHAEERRHDGSSDFLDKRPPWDAAHICGAVLVARNWVLTAKHCVTDVPQQYEHQPIAYFKANRRLRLGTHAIFDTSGTTCPPLDVVLHPGADDVALVRIEAEACTPNPNAQPVTAIAIAAPSAWKRYTGKTRFAVYGWGMTRARTADAYAAVINADPHDDTAVFLDPQWPFLQAGTPIYFVPRRTCLATPGYRSFVTATMLCAGVSSGKIDQCNGDSGGPLVNVTKDRNNRMVPMLVGIVEGGDGCGLAHTPGVYIYVPAYRDWIATTIGHGDRSAGLAVLARSGQGGS